MTHIETVEKPQGVDPHSSWHVDSGIEESRVPVKILIVDDNSTSLDAMENVLESENYEVLKAMSGAEALMMILRHEFALIFLDVRMPIMDGFETARLIRERQRSAHVPILFLTGYGGEDVRQMFKGYSLGAVDYLVKPVAPEVLRSKTAVFVQLYRKNEILRTQEMLLRGSHAELERRVMERTSDLAKVNDEFALTNARLGAAIDALEKQKEKMTNFISNVPGVVWEAWGQPDTTEQRMAFVSEFAEPLLGYSTAEWLKTPNFWLEIVHPEDRKAAGDTAAAAYKDGESGTSEFRWLSKAGKEIWVEAHFAVIVSDNGEPIGMRGVTMDITLRKLAEKEIHDSLKEKDMLLKEIHHRVKNNLQIVSSILSLQSSYIREPQLLEIFHESQARIKSIALIHELLYGKGLLARIEFKDYLENLVENIFRTFGADPDRIEYSIECDSAPMELDSAIHCGLIVNELLTNSIKYAFPDGRKGKISISLKVENQKCVLIVEDDGIGLPENLEVKTSTSMGLQLVDTLITQIRATLEIRRVGGACFTFRFGVPHPKVKAA